MGAQQAVGTGNRVGKGHRRCPDAGVRGVADRSRFTLSVQGGPGAPGRRGMTLLEISIAVTIFMIALLAAFGSQKTALDLTRTSEETQTAVSEMRACMEELLVLPADQIPLATGPYAPDTVIVGFNDRALTNQRITVSYPGLGGGVVPDPLEIRLAMTWDDWVGRPRSLVLETMKAR